MKRKSIPGKAFCPSQAERRVKTGPASVTGGPYFRKSRQNAGPSAARRRAKSTKLL